MKKSITRQRREHLNTWAHVRHINSRPAEFTIESDGDAYLERWFVIRNGLRWHHLDPVSRELILTGENSRRDRPNGQGNVFVHKFLRSDEDRALHDHPWSWVTLLLSGSYYEHTPCDPALPSGPTKASLRQEGDLVHRQAHMPHRVELINRQPVITLFITQPKEREWGFWCEKGWRHWLDFIRDRSHGSGTGCG